MATSFTCLPQLAAVCRRPAQQQQQQQQQPTAARTTRRQAARCAATGWQQQQQRVALPSVSCGGGAAARLRPVRAVMDMSSATDEEGESSGAEADEAEAPYDAYDEASEEEARKIAIELAIIADDTRAADIRVLGVSKKVHWARYFVVATAFNRPQMQAVAGKMRDHMNENHNQGIPKQVANQGDWVCVDCGEVVIHVFTPSSREFYDIETLYRDAEDVELPFVTERPQDAEDEFEVFQ